VDNLRDRLLTLTTLAKSDISWANKHTIYAYHRTRSEYNVANIAYDKYNTSSGMYGAGMYSTYSLSSQFGNRMLTLYGQVVLQSKIDLRRYLIFDRPIRKHVGLPAWRDQLRQHKLKSDYLKHDGDFSSEIAMDIMGVQHGSQNNLIRKTFAGLVFTGSKDGHVIVTFDLSTVTPMAYAKLYGLGLMAARKGDTAGINWQPIDKSKLPVKGTNFVDAIMQQGSTIPYNKIMQFLDNAIDKLDDKHKGYFLYRLITSNANPKNHVFGWLLSNDSDSWIMTKFSKQIGKLPSWKRALALGSWPIISNQILTTHKVFRGGSWTLARRKAANKYGAKLQAKLYRLLIPEWLQQGMDLLPSVFANDPEIIKELKSITKNKRILYRNIKFRRHGVSNELNKKLRVYSDFMMFLAYGNYKSSKKVAATVLDKITHSPLLVNMPAVNRSISLDYLEDNMKEWFE
jgi:hypothetical protein